MNTELIDQLISLEKELHRSDVRSSKEKLANLISDDFWEIGASGISFGKAEVLSKLPEAENFRIRAFDFDFKLLSNEIAQVLYKSEFYSDEGKLLSVSLRSSIWRLEKGRWLIVFHQGTPTK